jgi:hypothetical protein
MKYIKNIIADFIEILHNKMFMKKIIQVWTMKLGTKKINNFADNTKTRILFLVGF